MAILLLFASFIGLFLLVGVSSPKTGMKEILLQSALFFSAVIFVGIETAGAIHQLNYSFLLFYWGIILVSVVGFLYRRKNDVVSFSFRFKNLILERLGGLSLVEKGVLFFILVLLALIFFQGIFYPPNNWDSMTYHMTRVYKWMDNQSLGNFPTHITRQLYQPVFCEYVICHFNILSGSDYFSNHVQFLYFLFSILSVVCIAEALGLTSQLKKAAFVLAVTIPEALLQSSSTQNDVVHSFFMLASVYYGIKCIRDVQLKHFTFFGFSLGMTLLSKAIAYLYSPVICLFLGVIIGYRYIKTKNTRFITYSIVAFLVFVAVNFSHSFRNYSYSGNIIGIPDEENHTITNENLTPLFLFSNVLKNVWLHNDDLFTGNAGSRIIEKIHLLINVDLNRPGSNLYNIKYKSIPSLENHEDYQPNFIHMCLIIISGMVLLFRLVRNKFRFTAPDILLLLVACQFLFFCYYLTWEPWNSRLHTPLFFLVIPVVCYALGTQKIVLTIFEYIVIPVLLFHSFYIVIFNYTRPYISKSRVTTSITIKDDRYKKQFSNFPKWYPDYLAVTDYIQKNHLYEVGIIENMDAWEYPLYSRFYGKELIHSTHINVKNITRNIKVPSGKIKCIVADGESQPFILYGGKKYYNKTPQNKAIWVYE